MRRWAGIALGLCVLIAGKPAFAHRIDEYLQATLLTVERDRVQASMRLVPGVLVASTVIDAVDTDHDGVFSEAEERAYSQRVLGDLSITLDGKAVRPRLSQFSFPQPPELRDGLGEIHLDFVIDVSPRVTDRRLTVVNQHLRPNSVYLMNVIAPAGDDTSIIRQTRNQQQSAYELDFRQASVQPTTRTDKFRGCFGGSQFSSMFHLGMRHIAEGTDHLLFLLVLLLPAPLYAIAGRWGGAATVRKSVLHILGIVTAFTLGHSLTLTLAATGIVRVPARPVEVLIAVSILVSAVHAMWPIFPGREAWVAIFFGLIHGLAFASTLDRLGLSRWNRVAGVLAFNLGIEAMQMIVIAAILPSLLLLSRTRAYRFFRVGGAAFAVVVSLAWISERLFDLRTPVDLIVNGVARHGLAIAGGLLFAGLAFQAFARPFNNGSQRVALFRR